MINTNELVITEIGENSIANANAGGFLIDITSFKLGDNNAKPQKTHTNLLGTISYTGTVSFVEVLTPNTARFTLDIPDEIPGIETLIISEVGIFLKNGQMFARGIFDPGFTKFAKVGIRIYALISCTSCDLTSINVTVGSHSSIPSVPYLNKLPSPASSIHNVVAVLDQKENPDGELSGSLAVKYGLGGQQWSFIGYDRVFTGVGTSVQPDRFRIPNLTNSVEFYNNEKIIVQVLSGKGSGETKRFFYRKSDDSFIKLEESFNELDAQSIFSVWKKMAGGAGMPIQTIPWPPDREGIPENYVLIRGKDEPVWAAPSSGGQLITTLYEQPGTARFKYLYFTGDGKKSVYDLGIEPQSITDTFISISGIIQNRQAYEIEGKYLVLTEPAPINTTIEVWLSWKELSSGIYLEAKTVEYVSSGALEYDLPSAPPGTEYIFVSLSGFKQYSTAYSYDKNNKKLIFNEEPIEGGHLEITCLTPVNSAGYSLKIINNDFLYTDIDISELDLSVSPDSKEHVFISVSGIYLHKNSYSVINNKIILASPIKRGRRISVTVFKNIMASGTPTTGLTGVVTDGMATAHNLLLFRHGQFPVKIPFPRINILAGEGIEIDDQYPDIRIHSNILATLRKDSPKRFNTLHTLEDVEEIIFTYRLDFEGDIIAQVNADFSARLGPGFVSDTGNEMMEFVVGFRTVSVNEPPYGRRIKGSGISGFSYLPNSNYAYSNSSLTQTFELIRKNNPSGYVDLVTRMRIRHGKVSEYGSLLAISFNLITLPSF